RQSGGLKSSKRRARALGSAARPGPPALGRGDARLHALAARAARPVFALPAGVLRNAVARLGPLGGLPVAGRRAASRSGGVGRNFVSARAGPPGARTGFRARRPQQRGRDFRSGLCRRVALRLRAGYGALEPPGGGLDYLLLTWVRLRRASGHVLDRQQHHAAEKESGLARINSGQGGGT